MESVSSKDNGRNPVNIFGILDAKESLFRSTHYVWPSISWEIYLKWFQLYSSFNELNFALDWKRFYSPEVYFQYHKSIH